jgi:hypothetical protein
MNDATLGAVESSVELTLALFVSRVIANHVHHAATAHDLTALANPLDAGADLHACNPTINVERSKANQYSPLLAGCSRPDGD